MAAGRAGRQGGVSVRWAALDAARHRRTPRVTFLVGDAEVGSIARAHLPALRRWPQWLAVHEAAVVLRADPTQRSRALAEINAGLRDDGLIVAWRDEIYPVLARADAAPLALIERASARFWGTLTFGAHCNGFVADARGRPTHLWIARRSLTKATDPGKLDNLVGGGVPHGQSPFETLVREGFEEAGLDAATMRRATPGRVIELRCDIAEGFMHEHLHTFDLELPAGLTPRNQDGEVAELHCRPVAEAIDRAAGGEMTVDAALVTLDFALRHGLLAAEEAVALAPRLAALSAAGARDRARDTYYPQRDSSANPDVRPSKPLTK
jgi:8-oxo-dGTP pyrophosphatase MutT (NUDIX family)